MAKKNRISRTKKREAIENFLSNLFILTKKQDRYLEEGLNPNNRKYPRPVKG